MADLTGINQDENVAESGKSFEQLPEGNYLAVIVGDELKQNSQKTGMLLKFNWQIIDQKEGGKYMNRTIDSRHNIQHTSEVTQRIGQGELKRICNVCGVPYPLQNTEPLFGKPVSLFIKESKFKSNKTADDGSEIWLKSNDIKAYNMPPKKTTQTQEKTVTNNGGGDW